VFLKLLYLVKTSSSTVWADDEAGFLAWTGTTTRDQLKRLRGGRRFFISLTLFVSDPSRPYAISR